MTGLSTLLEKVLDTLPSTSDLDLQDWLDDVAASADLPAGFLKLAYRESAAIPGRWFVDVNVNFARIFRAEKDVDITLGDFGDLGPISGSALDGFLMGLRVDGAARLNLDLQLVGSGLTPVELRLLDSSGLSVGAGLRLAQKQVEEIKLSDGAKTMLAALQGGGNSFDPSLMLAGGTMWLSSDAGAQTQTVTLKRGTNLTATTFRTGDIVTTATGAAYSATGAQFGIVTGWDHTTGVLTLFAPSGSITGGTINVFDADRKLAKVNSATGAVDSSGNWFDIMSASAPQNQVQLIETSVAQTGLDITRILGPDDRITVYDGSTRIWTGRCHRRRHDARRRQSQRCGPDRQHRCRWVRSLG